MIGKRATKLAVGRVATFPTNGDDGCVEFNVHQFIHGGGDRSCE